MALLIFGAWIDISIVNKTSQEANWNGRSGRQTGRQTDGQDHVLSQADALTKKKRFMWTFLHFLMELLELLSSIDS